MHFEMHLSKLVAFAPALILLALEVPSFPVLLELIIFVIQVLQHSAFRYYLLMIHCGIDRAVMVRALAAYFKILLFFVRNSLNPQQMT